MQTYQQFKIAGFFDFLRPKPKTIPGNIYNDKRANSIRLLIAAQLGLDKNEVTDNMTWDDLGADDLDQVEIAMGLEDKFRQEVPDSFMDTRTVGDAIKYMKDLKTPKLKPVKFPSGAFLAREYETSLNQKQEQILAHGGEYATGYALEDALKAAENK